jgi:hypothetical protein
MRLGRSALVAGCLFVAAAGDPPSPPSASAMADDRIICKRVLETGSLVRKTKQCFTSREWARIAASQEAGARKLVDDLRERPASNN